MSAHAPFINPTLDAEVMRRYSRNGMLRMLERNCQVYTYTHTHTHTHTHTTVQRYTLTQDFITQTNLTWMLTDVSMLTDRSSSKRIFTADIVLAGSAATGVGDILTPYKGREVEMAAYPRSII
jgi:hypothetical protein